MRKFFESTGFKIASIIVKVLIWLCLIAFVISVCMQRFSNNRLSVLNFRMFTVVSGSMKPKYNIGDVLIAKEIKPEDVKVGDTISYQGTVNSFKDKVVTHQVVGIEKVDVLLITHYDKDHVGGADYVVRENKVDQVILPAYVGTNSEYMDFMKALDQKKISRTEVTEPMEFSLGQASVTVEPPQSYVIPNDGKEYDNDLSLITTVEFAGKRLVFAGDIEKRQRRAHRRVQQDGGIAGYHEEKARPFR